MHGHKLLRNCISPVCNCIPSATPGRLASESKYMRQEASSVTASYSGFVNGDSAASLPIAPTCWTTATSSSPYPTYCSEAADPNYTIDASSYVSGTLTVRP